MSENPPATAPREKGRQALAWVLSLWTLVCALSLGWNLAHMDEVAHEAAWVSADAAYFKDLNYRRWNSSHAGVYVPATERTPPNPHLAHVADRDVFTQDGVALTKVNPDYMMRQVHEIERDTGAILGHFTSLNPLRPENAPAPWEREALKQFEDGLEEYRAVSRDGGRQVLRLMRPMVTEPSCLNCHGEQGYAVGDVRGGISVSVPMEPYLRAAMEHQEHHLLAHGFIFLIGVGGIFFGKRRIDDHAMRRHQSDARFFRRVRFERTVNEAALALTQAPEDQTTEDLETALGKLAGLIGADAARMQMFDGRCARLGGSAGWSWVDPRRGGERGADSLLQAMPRATSGFASANAGCVRTTPHRPCAISRAIRFRKAPMFFWRSRIRAVAWTRKPGRACAIPFSPRNSSGGDWAWPCSRGWFNAWTARLTSGPPRTKARASVFMCRSAPSLLKRTSGNRAWARAGKLDLVRSFRAEIREV